MTSFLSLYLLSTYKSEGVRQTDRTGKDTLSCCHFARWGFVLFFFFSPPWQAGTRESGWWKVCSCVHFRQPHSSLAAFSRCSCLKTLTSLFLYARLQASPVPVHSCSAFLLPRVAQQQRFLLPFKTSLCTHSPLWGSFVWISKAKSTAGATWPSLITFAPLCGCCFGINIYRHKTL